MSLYRTLCVLADISFSLGAIDSTEHTERVDVARWLCDEDNSILDPRGAGDSSQDIAMAALTAEPFTVLTARNSIEKPDWIEFVAFGKWYFTKSDPDPYPSTPHGHLQSATRHWPKLNPYTGRAFARKHQEDTSLRLTKEQMRELWRTEAFRDFCRSHIAWYVENHPHPRFPVAHPMRFPRW